MISLERQWFRALIVGTRTAPYIVWLERPIREWESLPHSEHMGLVDSLSPWPSSFVSLSQLFSRCLFKLGEALLLCITERSKTKVSHTLISIPKAFRSLLQASTAVYNLIGACQWGNFPELILHKGDCLGSDCRPFSKQSQASANVTVN